MLEFFVVIPSVQIQNAFTLSRRMNQIQDNGLKRMGFSNTQESAIALLLQAITHATGGASENLWEILREYEFHPGSKCADADGNPCSKQTIGLLQRRHIQVEQIKYIGKESNRLEDVQSGMIHSAQTVYTEYPDLQRDEWQTKILPALKKIPLPPLVKLSGKSRRMLMKARAGRTRPHPKSQKLLASIVRKLGII